MDNGIVSDYSNLIIPGGPSQHQYAHFNDIITYSISPSGYSSIEDFGNGILSYGKGYIEKQGNSTSQYPDFSGCQRGINVWSAQANIYDNIMDTMEFGIKVQ
jgi:hypothetical protein